MRAQALLALLCALCRGHRLVSLLRRDCALKSSGQIDAHYRHVVRYFGLDTEDALLDTWNWDVFMYLDGRETVAYGLAAVRRGMERGRWPWGGKRPVPYVSFYSLLVVERHRGQGLCDRLLRDMVRVLGAAHGLPPDTLLTLHLSPSDPLMYVAAKVYYRMGFTRGVFSTTGPIQFQHQADMLEGGARDLYTLAGDSEASARPGGYVTLCCRLRDFGRPVRPPPDCIERGRALMELLETRAAHAA